MRTIAKEDEAGAARLAAVIARKAHIVGTVPSDCAKTSKRVVCAL
jgi:hypothetical protein